MYKSMRTLLETLLVLSRLSHYLILRLAPTCAQEERKEARGERKRRRRKRREEGEEDRAVRGVVGCECERARREVKRWFCSVVCRGVSYSGVVWWGYVTCCTVLLLVVVSC